MAKETDLKDAVLSTTKFRKQNENCSTQSFVQTENTKLKIMLHILEGYISNRTEQLPTAIGIRNKKENTNMAREGPVMTYDRNPP